MTTQFPEASSGWQRIVYENVTWRGDMAFYTHPHFPGCIRLTTYAASVYSHQLGLLDPINGCGANTISFKMTQSKTLQCILNEAIEVVGDRIWPEVGLFPLTWRYGGFDVVKVFQSATTCYLHIDMRFFHEIAMHTKKQMRQELPLLEKVDVFEFQQFEHTLRVVAQDTDLNSVKTAFEIWAMFNFTLRKLLFSNFAYNQLNRLLDLVGDSDLTKRSYMMLNNLGDELYQRIIRRTLLLEKALKAEPNLIQYHMQQYLVIGEETALEKWFFGSAKEALKGRTVQAIDGRRD